jgi:hypothetical protein
LTAWMSLHLFRALFLTISFSSCIDSNDAGDRSLYEVFSVATWNIPAERLFVPAAPSGTVLGWTRPCSVRITFRWVFQKLGIARMDHSNLADAFDIFLYSTRIPCNSVAVLSSRRRAEELLSISAFFFSLVQF